MRTEQQNMAIALSMGWTNVRRNDHPETRSYGPTGLSPGPFSSYDHIPDFVHDTNAMLKAQLHLYDLPDGTFARYEQALELVCRRNHKGWVRTPELLICATAAERAEAYLCTIGRWNELNELG